MGGKRPRSFITDGDLSMANAMAKVCPDADHRLCTWHIKENAKRHLHGDALTKFRRLVYEVMKADEFERRWCAFKNRDNVPEKELWLAMMYTLREKWAAAYTDGRYFLGMRSNQRSEGLNSRIHSHLDRKMSLIDVIEHFMCCVSRMRRNEAEMDARASQSVPFTKISAEALEKSAARFFTHVIFREVRAEIRKICKWVILEVRQLDEARRYSIASKYDHKVHGEVSCSFDGALLTGVKCYCQMMDSKEIPCSHIFTVLKYLRNDIIPQCCVAVRWTLQAKAAFPSVRTANVHEWSEQMDQYCLLRNIANEALVKASLSFERSQQVIDFFENFMREGAENEGSVNETTLGPLPAHFSASNQPSGERVLDPHKIVPKGRIPSKRLKPCRESYANKRASH